MKLPKFSFVQSDTDLPGCGYILHGEERPYHFARILKFGNQIDLASALNNDKKLWINKQVTGYSILIVLAGSMEGKIYVSAEGTANLERMVKEMAEWYYERHIKPNLNKFKKYELSF
jgi:hypothetical protein